MRLSVAELGLWCVLESGEIDHDWWLGLFAVVGGALAKSRR